MKYSTTIVACAAVLSASSVLAAPSMKPNSHTSYLEARGQPASKGAKKISDMAASEGGRRAAQFGKKVVTELATNAGQEYLDSQKNKDGKKDDKDKSKDKRSFDDDFDLALREFLEARGQPASKGAKKISDMAASEGGRRAAQFGKKLVTELATNAGQDYLDSQKNKDGKKDDKDKSKDKRSFDDDFDLALREFLEARGQPASKGAKKISDMAASEGGRRAAQFGKKLVTELATNAGQDYLDSQKNKDGKKDDKDKSKDKRSFDDDFDLALREFLEARGQPASKGAKKISDMAASEGGRRAAQFGKKLVTELATNAGQDYLDSQKNKDGKKDDKDKSKDKRSFDDDFDLALREFLEARGQPASKGAKKISDMAASEGGRRAAQFGKKLVTELATNAGQDYLDSQKNKDGKKDDKDKSKDKRSFDDDFDLALREFLEARGQPASKGAKKISDMAASEGGRRAAQFGKKVVTELATNAGQEYLDSQKNKDGKKDDKDKSKDKRSVDDLDSILSRRQYLYDLVDVVERELERREYGAFNDLD